MVQVDKLAAQHPTSLDLAEAVAKLYDEMNRETNILMRWAFRSVSARRPDRGSVQYARPARGYRSVRLPQSGTYRGAAGQGRSLFPCQRDGPRCEGCDGFDAVRGRLYRRGARAFGQRSRDARRDTCAAGPGRLGSAGGNFPAVLAAVQRRKSGWSGSASFSPVKNTKMNVLRRCMNAPTGGRRARRSPLRRSPCR